MHKSFLKKINIFRSLKVRIFLIVFLVGLIPCVCIRFSMLYNYEQRSLSARESDVTAQTRILANHLITYRYLQDTSSDVVNAELDQITNLYDGRILIINSDLRVVKDTYGISDGKTIVSEEVIRCLRGENASRYDANNGYLEIAVPIQESISTSAVTDTTMDTETETTAAGVVLISVSTDTISATLELLSRQGLVVEMLLIIILVAISVLAAFLLTRPLRKISEDLDRVEEGYTNDPIQVSGCAETERIGEAFNRVLARMKVLDDSRQEFVANVSHELKTPITSIKVLADSLRTQGNVPPELYQEFMEDIADEIDREDQIINDLLSLVKMDGNAAELHIAEVDINHLVEQVLKRLGPVATEQNVELFFESVRPVTADVDEIKFSMVLTNLVENAVKYNKEQGWVKVKLDADHQSFTVEVSDSGIGIPEEAQAHIFERFYRVDKSHSREIGGTGLGLAIARSAVLMHRGTIRVDSVEGEGTTFTVKIPLTHVG